MALAPNYSGGLGRTSSNASSASNTSSSIDTARSLQNGMGVKRAPDGCNKLTRAEAHLQDVNAFVQKVRKDLATILKQKTVYDRVFVLLVYWNKSDVKHIKRRAEELERCFSRGFDFETQSFVLTAKNKDLLFSQKLNEIAVMLSQQDKNNLFILYYSGHGWYDDQANQGGRCFWRPKKHSEDRDSLVWSDFEKPIRYADCDVLYIFDCCFGLAMIEGPDQAGTGGWKRRCEILSSAGLVEQAGGEEENSFTTALTSELDQIKDTAGMSAQVLGALLSTQTKRIQHKLVATPGWRMWSNDKWKSNIVLAKKVGLTTSEENSSDISDPQPRALQMEDLAELELITDTTVLIAISFENPLRLPVAEEWSRWFQSRPPNIASIELELLTTVLSNVVLNNDHKSNSNLALVTVPTWLWQWMAPHPAIKKVGVVRTNNLMPPQYSSGLPLYSPPSLGTPPPIPSKSDIRLGDDDVSSRDRSPTKTLAIGKQVPNAGTVTPGLSKQFTSQLSDVATVEQEFSSRNLEGPRQPAKSPQPLPLMSSRKDQPKLQIFQPGKREKNSSVVLGKGVMPYQDDKITTAPLLYSAPMSRTSRRVAFADVAWNAMLARRFTTVPGISYRIRLKLNIWAQGARARARAGKASHTPEQMKQEAEQINQAIQGSQDRSSLLSRLERLLKRSPPATDLSAPPPPVHKTRKPLPLSTMPHMIAGNRGDLTSAYRTRDAGLVQEEDLLLAMVARRTRHCPQLLSF